MSSPFKFLSTEEFERLGSPQKLEYLSDAMDELERAKVPREVRGWHSLFTQEQQQQQAHEQQLQQQAQQQQQQQPLPEDKPSDQ